MQSHSDHVKSQFSTVYITIVSVALGLNLAEVVSILRGTEHHTLGIWIQALAVTHLIFNAWYGYSTTAIVMQVIPNVWDSLNVFFLAGAHFVMVTFIGAEPHWFAFAVSVYALTACFTIIDTARRFSRETRLEASIHDVVPMIVLNCSCAIVIGLLGVANYRGFLPNWGGIIIGCATLVLASAWLLTFIFTTDRKIRAQLQEAE